MLLNPFSPSAVQLMDHELKTRREKNRRYMYRLRNEGLMQNYKLEAGLLPQFPEETHGGWEAASCQLRGHFLGHWLSAAARMHQATGDIEIKAKADALVAELAECQRENGGEWAGSIPEKYLEWIARGKPVWAPQYTIHKTFMGLVDMKRFTGNDQALEIAVAWSAWFVRWTKGFTEEQMDDVLDFETGGMLEVWADLYELTKKDDFLFLMDRYDRRRLFRPLVEGRDVLTNMHANTTVPEILGAARCYEVTGDEKWLEIVKAYWKCAVTDRGQFCTGGQTCGEVWTPVLGQSARLGEKNQEHCTVYNMMRLAEFLLRCTGDVKYADYWEQNLYNGIMAQGFWEGSFTHGQTTPYPKSGLLTYFLPLRAGSRKGWASETNDFFCCHGTLVQANARHTDGIWYRSDDGIRLYQYIPSDLACELGGEPARLSLRLNDWSGNMQRHELGSPAQAGTPDSVAAEIRVTCGEGVEFPLGVRIPWWTKANAVVTVNGEARSVVSTPGSLLRLNGIRNGDFIRIVLPKGISVWPLADRPDTVAFLDGPVVLAGLTDEDRMLYGDPACPESILVRDNEREWSTWMNTWRTVNQDRGIRFIPLHRVGYEPYSVYFQVQ